MNVMIDQAFLGMLIDECRGNCIGNSCEYYSLCISMVPKEDE